MESRTYNFGVLLSALNNLRAEFVGLSDSDILGYDVLITHDIECGLMKLSLIPPEWDQFSSYDLERRVAHDQAAIREAPHPEHEDEYRPHGEVDTPERIGQ